MGLFLQTGLSHSRIVRTVVGLLITSLLLLVQPFIYASPTQTYGIGMASSCCLAAWTLLHWTFMEPLDKRPTILHVCCSTVTHPMAGMIKVYKRSQRHRAKSATPGQQVVSGGKVTAPGMQLRSSGRPLVVVDACGEVQLMQPHTACHTLSTVAEALITMLGVAICYDAGLYLLCAFSHGMCIPGDTAAPAPSSRLAVCLFAYAAGSLLPLQMDMMYCFLRSGMCAGALVWPALGDYARQLPPRAFNSVAASRSISELWSARWHQFLRFYFEGMGYSGMDKLLHAISPNPKAVSPALRSSMHTVSAFVMSALMHEYLTWAAFGTVTGMYVVYFGLHCALVLLEGWGPLLLKAAGQVVLGRAQKAASRASHDDTTASAPAHWPCRTTADKKPGHILPIWAQHVWATVFLVLLAPLFIEPYRAGGYFAQRAWHPAGVSITGCVVEWAQQHLHAPLGFAGLPSYLVNTA